MYGFDYVIFEHTELQALLTADMQYQHGSSLEELVYLRRYYGDSP